VAALLRLEADQAFSRAAGAPLVAGNQVALLRDAGENYPAWLDAIARAEKWIHFEMYLIHSDRAGRMFAEALAERARAGVRVRLLTDWLGSIGKTSFGFWRQLGAAGVETRSFNRLSLSSPFSWMARDHRKVIAVDGNIAFVTGLCIGEQWLGDPAKGVEPWRDTGVSIVGPAVADVEAAFAQAWAYAGKALPDDERIRSDQLPEAGDTAVRVIASMPAGGGMFRLDQLVTALARRSLWVTDAYFVGVNAYVEALCNAARDGVDVRLLVPGSGSDIAMIQRLTRAGYRSLLDGGVRVFEWNGPMIHAKTAVADGRWARVGSTNLNVQSWLGNWELDVAVEDERFGRDMEAMYEKDLENTSEIVLSHRRVLPASPRARTSSPEVRAQRRYRGRAARTAAGALRIGHTFSAVLTARRKVARAEAITLLYGAAMALGLALVAFKWPRALSAPIGVIVAWLGIAWAIRAVKLLRQRPEEGLTLPRDPDAELVERSVTAKRKAS
jgi:cardiolipin synthase A/B